MKPAEIVQIIRDKGYQIPVEFGSLVATHADAEEATGAAEKPLATKERMTWGALVGILCDMAKVDITTPHKAAGVIEAHAHEMSVPISEDTIAEKLKLAREALDRRRM